MKRSLILFLFTSAAFLNAQTTVTEGNFTFTFPEGWVSTDLGVGIPALQVHIQEGFYIPMLNTLIGSQFSDPEISPTHTLSAGKLINYTDIIINLIYETIDPYSTMIHIQNYTLNNDNGSIVRKADGDLYSDFVAKKLIYLFLDNNSAVSWVVDVAQGTNFTDTYTDIQQLDLVAQNATTTQPKQEYEPVVTYTEEEYNAVVTQRDARLTMDEVRDARVGSTMIEVSEGKADITMTLEETSDLSDWSSGAAFDTTIQVDAPAGTRFFRFKMTE